MADRPLAGAPRTSRRVLVHVLCVLRIYNGGQARAPCTMAARRMPAESSARGGSPRPCYVCSGYTTADRMLCVLRLYYFPCYMCSGYTTAGRPGLHVSSTLGQASLCDCGTPEAARSSVRARRTVSSHVMCAQGLHYGGQAGAPC